LMQVRKELQEGERGLRGEEPLVLRNA
jgi:hypothetical protein